MLQLEYIRTFLIGIISLDNLIESGKGKGIISDKVDPSFGKTVNLIIYLIHLKINPLKYELLLNIFQAFNCFLLN